MSGDHRRAAVRSAAVVGLRPVPVWVETDIGPGLPGFHVIGASGSTATQAADRVRAALAAVGVVLPARKVLVSLAPADVPKAGARFDLAMAVAVLAALDRIPAAADVAVLGELALDGRLRSVDGVLPCAAALPALGVRRVVLPAAQASEAALVADLDVVGADDLDEVCALLRGERAPRAQPPCPASRRSARSGADAVQADLEEVRGQAEARRALEVAAAGGHHLLLLGPPGCGKSMLARRLPGLLPPLGQPEALELAAIRSVAGHFRRESVDEAPALLDRRPPFRAPHHTASGAALLGGGSGVAVPGEISLAHHGVLFMDELLEWPRRVLDALREPLEERQVRVVRRAAAVTYPAAFRLVAASNPCPCGGAPVCTCTDEQVAAYRARLSGPLADRLDLAPTLRPLRAADLQVSGGAEPSAVVAARVAAARAAAADRGQPEPNAEASAAALLPQATGAARRELAAALESGELTGRGYDRALRVARTVADLAGSEAITAEHVAEARLHRLALRPAPVAA